MIPIPFNSIFEAVGELFSDETSIAVSDTKEYIYYQPSKRIDLKIQVGDPVKQGTIAYKALSDKRKVSEFIDRDLFGVPYYGVAVPLWHEGEVRGCVSAIFPTLATGKSVVTIKHQDSWIPVPFTKVMYVEASERKTHVVTEKLTGTHKYTLNEFEFLLPREGFIRCHRSFIVNVNYIKEIYPDTHSTLVLIMDNQSRISVSQSYASYFRKLLGF
ncbi:LytTR family DNA-binding domain-containing protein [Paenibacillus sp. TAB 01]|uniref:LytTR family DNA-binding domain-containing protein n=1 Tax=Paenibacillus sp. TAB 01 TaxID=3368988 RepID=UPI0037532C21